LYWNERGHAPIDSWTREGRRRNIRAVDLDFLLLFELFMPELMPRFAKGSDVVSKNKETP